MDKKATNLQFKFILALGGFGILCAVGIGMLTYTQYHGYIISSLQETLRDAGELLESQMPVLGDVDSIRQEGLAESEAYMDILRNLKAYNDAFKFSFVYLIENGPNGFIFLLNTDRLGKDADNTFLTAVPDAVAIFLPDVVESRQIGLSDIYTDKFGTFMSAFVPVVRQNRTVGVIGLDYEISHIRSLERRALLQIFFCMVITVAVVIIAAIVVSKAFVGLVRKTDTLNKHLLFTNEKLSLLLTTDELTQLNNRHAFLEYMDIVWKQHQRLGLPITILMIDVDFLKRYNDSFGRAEGDKALIDIARCIKNHTKRDIDFVARFGSDEFVCVLPFTESGKAAAFAGELATKIENLQIPCPAGGRSGYLTVSVGMASAVPGVNNSRALLLDDAYRELREAKKSGGNGVS
jgi:diguanylate cyclase (GGDEF)-like protein